MEFNEKLQELRKQRGLTQEALADALYVSRTAVSKWESGRGYPNIDSLKAIARFFSVSIDSLLSGDEMLTIAEETQKLQKNQLRTQIFGMLDLSGILLLFLPFFRQGTEAVSLLTLTEIQLYLRAGYCILVAGMAVTGFLTLLQAMRISAWWETYKNHVSLGINAFGVFLLIISLQPYAAVFLLVFLLIKVFFLFSKS